MSLGTQSIGGLASGFDTANIIEQLMSIERRPINKMEISVKEKELKLDAYRATNNLLSSYYTAIQKAAERSTWNTKSASSTNEAALGVQADQYAEPGSYSLRVGRLASAAQYTSAGFANQQTSPVSPTKSGFITIDNGAASLRRSSKLADLNGGAGIYHGSIRISQGGVGTATIDLTTAETIEDVVNAINDTTGVNVTARVSADGYALELVDNIGTGISVQNVGVGTTATDLGLETLTDHGGGVHGGTDIRVLTGQTHLAMLRDGLGINGGTLGTIGITDGAEDEFGVDLSDARSAQDVIRIINEHAVAAGSTVRASLSDTERGFKLTGTGMISVRSDISEGRNRTAEDLGLTVLDGAGNGQALLGGLNTVQVGTLSGQREFNRDTALAQFGLVDGDTFTLQDKYGESVTYTYTDGETVGDLLDTVNDPGDDAKVLVYMDPDNGRLVIGDTTRQTIGTFSASGTAAEKLGFGPGNQEAVDDISGLQGSRIFSGGINGSASNPAANLGKINVNIGGIDHEIDMTDLGADSNLSDILNRLNAADPGLRVALNRSGNGLQVTNATGADVTITALEGSAAVDLGLARTYATGTTTDAGNLDRKYISGATQLSTLAGGKGVPAGGIVITDSRGRNVAVDLSSAKTIQDVLDMIHESGAGVLASVNAKGDGIVLADTQGGTMPIEVSELGGGTTAKALGLLGSGRSQLDGSLETRIEVSTSDTLFDIMNKIGNSGADVQASIINDGSPYAPFRLVVNSKNTGEAGDILLDTNLDIFNFHKNAEGEDAILLQGRADSAASPMMLKSSTNRNNSAILGLTFDLKAVTQDFVNIAVSEDTEIAYEAVNEVVQAYNDLQGFIKEFDTWDDEEGKPGLFFGDRSIRNLLDNVTEDFFRVLETPESGLSTWYDIGVKFSREGNVELDTAALREALNSNFAAVRDLMTVRNDVARRDYNTSVRTSAAAVGFTTDGVINGNTNSRDFGNGNGYQSATPINGNHSLTLDFGKTRLLNSLNIHHINSESMPANEYALSNFKIEYLDAMTNSWNTLREVNGNKAASTSVGFAEATQVSQVRITATGTNAPDKLFRLVEIEAFEADGLASRQSINTKALTDFETGFFAREEREINSQIKDMQQSIDRMEARMEMKESNLVRSFTAMETALSQLSTQGDFFTAQMDALGGDKK